MAQVRPMSIPGRWREGFVLDYHTIGSTYIGEDEYGHPIFDTKRTEIGELLYRLKYRSDISTLDEIAWTAIEFVKAWNPGVEIIIPVPASRSGRPLQPVLLIAEELGKRLNITFGKDCIKKVKEIPELKNVYEYDERLRLLEGAHIIERASVGGKRVLLFDDLFRSGATMNAITRALYDEGRVTDVFALAITRTRSKS